MPRLILFPLLNMLKMMLVMVVFRYLQEGLKTRLRQVMLSMIGMCPRVSIMLVINYEPLFYITKVLEPGNRFCCLLWVDHVPYRDDYAETPICILVKRG